MDERFAGRSGPERREARLAWTLTLPSLAVTVGAAFFALAWTVWESLHLHDLRMPWRGRPFVGLDNYVEALSDQSFWLAFGHTAALAVTSISLEILLGLVLALALDRAFLWRGVVRTAALLPWAIPTVVAALVWRFFFAETSGGANGVLIALGWIDERDFWVPIRNSLVVAGATTLLSGTLGALAACALARLRFRGKRPILAFVLAIAMFPQISIVSPLYLILRALGLIDTYPGLVLPYLTFAMPLTIWLLASFFRQLPAEIENAALVDGPGCLRVLAEIVLPLSAPALAATAILTFVYCWNEFLFALSFTLGPERQTVPVAIALFRGQYRVPWGQIFAAAVVATAPVAALVLAFQRRIVQGVAAGGVKG